MITWWSDLSSLNQAFFAAAVFFSTIFIWQFFSSLSGLGGETTGDADGGHLGGDAHVGGDSHVGGHGHFGEIHTDTDAGSLTPGDHAENLVEDAAGLATFRLLSIRSILAFATLFSWAGALYLQDTIIPALALVHALLWGMAGMAVVAFFFWALPRLTEEGTADLDTAIGKSGQVYLDIPEGGIGQIRVLVSGAVSYIKARSRNEQALPAGTMVRVTGRLDSATLEVEELES